MSVNGCGLFEGGRARVTSWRRSRACDVIPSGPPLRVGFDPLSSQFHSPTDERYSGNHSDPLRRRASPSNVSPLPRTPPALEPLQKLSFLAVVSEPRTSPAPHGVCLRAPSGALLESHGSSRSVRPGPRARSRDMRALARARRCLLLWGRCGWSGRRGWSSDSYTFSYSWGRSGAASAGQEGW